jgi:hypothetical protein
MLKLSPILFAVLPLIAADVRLSNDSVTQGGYISAYTIATGTPYTDPVIQECSIARGRQNEPAVAMNPRDPRVIVGSSNDYCGVYAGSPVDGMFVPSGPIWLGYYRSENAGQSFRSSLVPGYPGDTSPYAALAKVRTAGAGDPVLAWDNQGRLFAAAESSDDPAGTKKTFGDEWVARFENPDGPNGNTLNDGKAFRGSVVVAKGASAPDLKGKFHDKTSIEVDRTGGSCDGYVYFAWSRFTGNSSNIYFVRSTDHGATWTQPQLLTASTKNVQDPDIAVTGNGHVYVTYGQGATTSGQEEAVAYVRSADCGATFGKAANLAKYIPYEAQDISAPTPVPPQSSPDDRVSSDADAEAPGNARDCGDFQDACKSGYTFFRRATSPRSTADQKDKVHEWVYVVYDATKPGTEVDTGTSYGSISSGKGSQSGAYLVRLDGATGAITTPALIDPQGRGHQVFPDISADSGLLYVVWWDSRQDPVYSPKRPIGNDANGQTYPSLQPWAAKSIDRGATWVRSGMPLSPVLSNPNYEQFDNRAVPFAGDYLWITSVGSNVFATWTDWRNTVSGTDPRESNSNDHADVKQCRTFDNSTQSWSGDTCPRDGGLDQDIYGAIVP